MFSSSIIPDSRDTVFGLKSRLRCLGLRCRVPCKGIMSLILVCCTGVNIIENDDQHFTHVSGHPLRGELRKLFQLLRPKVGHFPNEKEEVVVEVRERERGKKKRTKEEV